MKLLSDYVYMLCLTLPCTEKSVERERGKSNEQNCNKNGFK